jgi:hypothetical protein
VGTRLIASIAVCLALTVSACGGSSKDTAVSQRTTADATHLNARFFARANAICKRATVRVAAGPDIRSLATLEQAAARAADEAKAAVGQLQELTPPAAVAAADWSRLIAYRQQLADKLITLRELAASGSLNGSTPVRRSIDNLHRMLSGVARRVGVNQCAEIG